MIVFSVISGVTFVGCDRSVDPPGPTVEENPVAAEVAEVAEDPGLKAPDDGGVDDAAVGKETVGVEVTEITTVPTPETLDLDPEADENRAVREEVLERIDQIPSLDSDDKDQFYVRVDRAQGMGKVITIPFESGETRIGKRSADELGAKLEREQVRELIDDPTVVFVVLGFADTKGDPEKNLAISLERAESALDSLKVRYGLLNVMHAVGMGSSELLGEGDLEKNRVVEVWAVVP